MARAVAVRFSWVRYALALGAGLALALAMAAQANDGGDHDGAVTVGGAANQFSPNTITIPAGKKVVFTWAAGNVVSHNVVASNGAFNSGATQSTGTYTTPSLSSGTISYYCSPHQGTGMTGTIVVSGSGGGGGTTTGGGGTTTGGGGTTTGGGGSGGTGGDGGTTTEGGGTTTTAPTSTSPSGDSGSGAGGTTEQLQGTAVQVAASRIAQVAKTGRLTVQVAVEESSSVGLKAVLIRGRKRISIGSGRVEFFAAGQRIARLKLTSAGRRALRKARKATIEIVATIETEDGDVIRRKTRRTLKR